MRHIPEGHTKTLYTECVTCTQIRTYTLTWATVLLTSCHLAHEFSCYLEEKEKKGEERIRLSPLAGPLERAGSDRHGTGVRYECTISSAIFIESFKPKIVDWSHELAKWKYVFTPWYMENQVHRVPSLLWAILGDFSHILERLDRRKCRREPVGKWVRGFGLYCT